MANLLKRAVIATGLVGVGAYASFRCIEYYYIMDVRENPYRFQNLPSFWKTRRVCSEVLKQRPIYLMLCLFDNEKPQTMCDVACEKNPEMLEYVPKDKITQSICDGVIKKNAQMLRYVPANMRTNEMYRYCAKDSNGLNNFIGVTLPGKKFNELFAGKEFVKLTNEEENHNGHQFETGLNVDKIRFDDKCDCCAGGIYFTEDSKKSSWTKYGSAIMKYERPVIIPDDAQVRMEHDKAKADRLILGDRKLLQ